MIFDIAGYSDLLEADLQQKLNRVIYSDPAFTGETLDVKVKKIELGKSLHMFTTTDIR